MAISSGKERGESFNSGDGGEERVGGRTLPGGGAHRKKASKQTFASLRKRKTQENRELALYWGKQGPHNTLLKQKGGKLGGGSKNSTPK